jgi:hypothetical protein
MSPWGYTRAGVDVLGGLSDASAAKNAMELQQRQDAIDMSQRQFAQQYALQGLRNEMDQRQNQNNLANTKLRGLYSSVGNLLGGLFND